MIVTNEREMIQKIKVGLLFYNFPGWKKEKHGPQDDVPAIFGPEILQTQVATTQLLFQQNALVFIKSTRYYNLYFLSLHS
jgi:hypothetical protein